MARKNLQNFDEIKARLLQFAETQGIAKGQFYEKISMFPSNFAGKGAESALKSDNIVKVLTEFPELNSDWLLLGRGEMLRQPATHFATSPGDNPSVVAFLNSKLEKTEAELALANQTIGELRYIIRQLKEKVSSPSAATTPESTFA